MNAYTVTHTTVNNAYDFASCFKTTLIDLGEERFEEAIHDVGVIIDRLDDIMVSGVDSYTLTCLDFKCIETAIEDVVDFITRCKTVVELKCADLYIRRIARYHNQASKLHAVIDDAKLM